MTVVLVVDDDAAIRRTLGITLRARGYEVEPVADGRSALQAIAEQQPDEGNTRAEENSANEETTQTRSTLPELLHFEQPQGDGWIEFEKPILFLYAGKGPFVSRDLMQFPVSHPDDGYIDVVVQEKVSDRSCEPSWRLV